MDYANIAPTQDMIQLCLNTYLYINNITICNDILQIYTLSVQNICWCKTHHLVMLTKQWEHMY